MPKHPPSHYLCEMGGADSRLNRFNLVLGVGVGASF